MKILVLSDSHGNLSNMIRTVRLTKPRLILHLGDCWRDGERLHAMFPEIAFEQVPGNCDYRSSESAEKLLFWEGKRVLICHGHTYDVKHTLLNAGQTAEEQHLDLFLFGHTHRAFRDERCGTLFFNPGSIGDYHDPTYGIIFLENGTVNGEILHVNQ